MKYDARPSPLSGNSLSTRSKSFSFGTRRFFASADPSLGTHSLEQDGRRPLADGHAYLVACCIGLTRGREMFARGGKSRPARGPSSPCVNTLSLSVTNCLARDSNQRCLACAGNNRWNTFYTPVCSPSHRPCTATVLSCLIPLNKCLRVWRLETRFGAYNPIGASPGAIRPGRPSPVSSRAQK